MRSLMRSYNEELKWAKCLYAKNYWLFITPKHNSPS